jgi:hypothetical protein
MKVICLRKYINNPITLGKIYDVVEVIHVRFNPSRPYDDSGPFYRLLNDIGEISAYSNYCVRELTVAELREEQFKELGI